MSSSPESCVLMSSVGRVQLKLLWQTGMTALTTISTWSQDSVSFLQPWEETSWENTLPSCIFRHWLRWVTVPWLVNLTVHWFGYISRLIRECCLKMSMWMSLLTLWSFVNPSGLVWSCWWVKSQSISVILCSDWLTFRWGLATTLWPWPSLSSTTSSWVMRLRRTSQQTQLSISGSSAGDFWNDNSRNT